MKNNNKYVCKSSYSVHSTFATWRVYVTFFLSLRDSRRVAQEGSWKTSHHIYMDVS